MIGQPVAVDDVIVHYNNLYKVLKVGSYSIRAKLINASKTTKSKVMSPREYIKVDSGAVMVWLLKRDSK